MLYWSSMYRSCLLLLAQRLIGSFAYIVFVNAAMFMQGLQRVKVLRRGWWHPFSQSELFIECADFRTVLRCYRCFFPPHKATKHTTNAVISFLSRNLCTISQSGQLKSLNEVSKSLGLEAIMWVENKQSETRWPEKQERERQERGRKSSVDKFLVEGKRERGLELCCRIIYIARGRTGLREAEICFGQTAK